MTARKALATIYLCGVPFAFGFFLGYERMRYPHDPRLLSAKVAACCAVVWPLVLMAACS